MATREELTSGMFEVSPGLFMDNLGNFHNLSAQGQAAPNQWAWGETGLLPLGGLAPDKVTPFLDIQQQYAGGAPIEAESWQDAARQSLEGFMRTAHRGGLLAPEPAPVAPRVGGRHVYGMFSPLDRYLSAPGGAPAAPAKPPGPEDYAYGDPLATMFDPTLSGVDPGSQFRFGTLQDLIKEGKISLGGQGEKGFDPLMGLSPADKLLIFENMPTGSNIEQMLGQQASFVQPGQDQDYNDFIFKLALDQYQQAPELMKADPAQVMQQYFQTPAYGLMRGTGMDTTDPNMYADPTQRFKADPGYQFAQDEGMRNIQRNAAARGLLESGRTQRDLQSFGQNLADQNYQRWLGQEMAGFSDWQNQIRGLQAQGAQMSGPQAALQTGAGMAGAAMQGGSNLGNIFANQGVFGGSGMLNTAAAQGGNIMNAGAINAQIAAANAAAQGGAGGMGQAGQFLGSLLGGFF